MHITILGNRQGESKDTRFTSLLIDGQLAVDAGGLAAALSLEEQGNLRTVLLTHQHFDHTKDLASLGFNLLGRHRVRICCLPEVRSALEETILSDTIWLNFFKRPNPAKPTFIHYPVQPGQSFDVEGYHARAVRVGHPVPTVAYEISCPGSGKVVYTGDCSPGSVESWAVLSPDLLIIECTFSNSQTSLAGPNGHLSPQLLREELKTFRSRRGWLPRVAVIHVNPYHVKEITVEVAAVASELEADVWLPEQGETIVV